VRGTKRELCRRFGVRYQDLDAAGRTTVDLLARVQTKLTAVDRYFEQNPVVNANGEPAAVLPVYATLVNSAARLTRQCVEVLQAQRREEDALSRYVNDKYQEDEG
jgi:hypothetical protein